MYQNLHAPKFEPWSCSAQHSRPHHLIEGLERRVLLTGIAIVNDAFTDGPAYTGENISGRSPTGNDLPGSVYQITAGYDYDQQVLGNNNGTYSDSAYFHNVGATAISLGGKGSYNKPTLLQVSGQIAFELSSGYVSDAYLGFYSSIASAYNGNDLLNFSGLELNSNGSLTLVVDGSAVNTIPFTGSYVPGTYTALSYGVNTVTGCIYDVSLAGSTSDYTPFITTGFTNSATAYGGIGGDNDPSGKVHFASYQVAAVAAADNGAGVTAASLGSLSIPSGVSDVVAAPDVHSDRFVVVLNSLSIAGSMNVWQGRLDLSGNDLIVDGGNLSTLTNEIQNGAIFSSTAAGDSTHLTTLGIELNNNGNGQPLFGSGAADGLFDGQSPALNAVLIKYTYYGDANLDGKVDGSDYSRIDNGYLNHLTGWANGDFNCDGVIDGSDYTLIDNAFNSQGPILTTQTPPARLVFEQPPTNVAIGATITPAVTVDVDDDFGDLVSNDSSVVTLSIASGVGTLAGTTSVAAVDGVATFPNLSLATMGGYTFQATDASLAAAVSPLFTVANPVTISPGSGGLTNTDPFGVASSYTSTADYSTWAPQAAAAGAKWVRLFPEWSQIEPEQGTYNWSSVDAITTAAAANGQDVSGLLFYNASWVNSNTGTFPTSNLAAWSTYVSAVIAHTAGKVEYWEVWNEPENFATGGTPQDYADVVDTAYNAAKAVDPSAQIGLDVASVDINYLEQAIDDGAADHFDYISVHPYEVLGAVDQGWEGDYLSIVPTIRKMLAADDPAKENVPIWFTELGEQIGAVNGPTTVTAASQAQDLVKAFAMGIAQGVTRIDWYQAEDGGGSDVGFGLLDSSGNPTAAYTAMQSLTTYLGTSPQYQGWLQLNGTDDGFVFQGATASVMALWAQPNATDTVTFNANVKVVNPSTDTSSTLMAGSSLSLSNAPVLIVGIPGSLLSQAQSNKDQPFPWGGNNTNASSVSIQMGPVNIQSGLFQLDANETSTGVTIYGGPARLSNDSYSDIYQDFEVDPNFISYSPSTVNITVVARRDANDDPAGFNVGYESTAGLLNNTASGWWSIPGNDRWYSHIFSVSDAEFDSKWAFNFDINSDSPANGQFYIQSVTVTK